MSFSGFYQSLPQSVQAHDATRFVLSAGGKALDCEGVHARVDNCTAEDLERGAGELESLLSASARMLVGALPFDRTKPALLVAPQRCHRRHENERLTEIEAAPHRWHHAGGGDPSRYVAVVERALHALRGQAGVRGGLEKVVLARYLDLVAERPIDAENVYRRLAEDHDATAFLLQYPQAGGDTARAFVGATPELLIRKRGRRIVSHPLAGSAARCANKAGDRAAAAALQQSQKDYREHRLVVEAILDTLNPYCLQLSAPRTPELASTASMWHLGTPIEGTLKDADTPVLQLAAALHPTPAVGGVPRRDAGRLIDELEDFDRQLYAGTVGWMNAHHDGDWHVSIRCAALNGERARLYAGAGITSASDPVAETRETAAKFGALLSALGVERTVVDSALERAWPGTGTDDLR